MKFNKEIVLWIKIDLEGLNISDLSEEDKIEIKDEIKEIKKRNNDVDKTEIVLITDYDIDVLCDEELEEI